MKVTIYRINAFTSNSLGVKISFKKVFNNLEDAEKYARRQHMLLTKYEGYTLGSVNSCMATYMLDGILSKVLIREIQK